MMNKILVEILLPAADMSFDVYIPLENRMSETLFLISHMLTDLSMGKYKADKDAVLCDAVTGDVLDLNMHAAELNLKHGSKLMLI